MTAPYLRYPIGQPPFASTANLVRICLNGCLLARRCRGWARTPAANRHWHAALKARQLQLALLRVGHEHQLMRLRGWFEPDPETGEQNPLEKASREHMHALGRRKERALRVRDRIADAYLRPERDAAERDLMARMRRGAA